MPVIAVANQKGAVGETTTVVNPGAALAEHGHDFLAIDFDPQGSVTLALGINPDDLQSSVYDVLAAEINDRSGPRITEVNTQTNPGIELAPADMEPSEEFGDLYLGITCEYAEVWKE